MFLAPLFKRNPSSDPDEPKWQWPVIGLLIVTLLLGLLALAITGLFSRYQADDYCFSSSLIQYGYFGGLRDWYMANSNRFSAMLVIGLLDPFKVAGMQALPAVLIAGLAGGMYTLLHQLRQASGWTVKKMDLFLMATLAAFFTVYTAPDRFQSFYWRSGSVTYTLPVVLGLFLVALLVRQDRRELSRSQMILNTAILYLCSVLLGGFSETTAAFFTVFFGGTFILVWLFSTASKRTRRLTASGAVLAGLITAMVIMFLSPANALRLEVTRQTTQPLQLIYLSFRFALGFIVNTLQEAPLPFLVTGAAAFLLGRLGKWENLPGNYKRLFWMIPAGVLILTMAVCAPSAFGQSSYPELRALLPARWIFTSATATWFYLLGFAFQQQRLKDPKFNAKISKRWIALALIVISFYLMRATLAVLQDVTPYQQRAQAWDERAAFIAGEKAAGNTDLVVAAYDSPGRIRELSVNPKVWVNRCAAVFYGVERISAK